jgi:hypothetical protein
MEQFSIDVAWERHNRIVAMRHEVESTFLGLAKELYFFEKEKQYIEIGHPTFESYLADPDVDITRRLAFMLKGIYQTFVIEQKVQPVALLEAGTSKLEIIRPHVTEENIDDLLSQAKTLSRSDLRIAVGNMPEVEYEPPETCPTCGQAIRNRK